MATGSSRSGIKLASSRALLWLGRNAQIAAPIKKANIANSTQRCHNRKGYVEMPVMIAFSSRTRLLEHTRESTRSMRVGETAGKLLC